MLDQNNVNKFAENFSFTLDIAVDSSKSNDVTHAWESGENEKATRQLLFTSSEEYLQCQEDFGMFSYLTAYLLFDFYPFINYFSVP